MIVRVSCLPKKTEKELQELFWDIIAAAKSVKVLGLKSEDDMTILITPDSMKFGLGTDVVSEITALFKKKNRTKKVRKLLAKRIGEAIQKHVPKAKKVECFVYPYAQSAGCWSSIGWKTLKKKKKKTSPKKKVSM